MHWPLRLAVVRGPSMVPTLRHGDRLLVWLHDPQRQVRRPPRTGAVVLVELPDRPLSIKRVVAVGDGGAIRVAGDNPFGSTDSRQLGELAGSAVRGRALCRLWPPKAL